MEISALIAALKSADEHLKNDIGMIGDSIDLKAAEKLEELQKENEELKASNKRLLQVLWDLQ